MWGGLIEDRERLIRCSQNSLRQLQTETQSRVWLRESDMCHVRTALRTPRPHVSWHRAAPANGPCWWLARTLCRHSRSSCENGFRPRVFYGLTCFLPSIVLFLMPIPKTPRAGDRTILAFWFLAFKVGKFSCNNRKDSIRRSHGFNSVRMTMNHMTLDFSILSALEMR